MIKTFANKETAAIFTGERPRRFALNGLPTAMRKMAQLDAVQSVNELLIPPGNRLEKLSGDRQKGNTASVSTTNGDYASDLLTVTLMMLRSSITTKETTMAIPVQDLADMDFADISTGEKIPFPTPGEILLHDFLKPMGISQYRLAKEIGVSQRRIGEIISGKRSITVDTGLRLSCYFGMSDGFWTGLQLNYDTKKTKQALKDILSGIHQYNSEAA